MHLVINSQTLRAKNFPRINSLLNSFNDGKESGLTWRETYIPGGPWVMSCRLHQDPNPFTWLKCCCQHSKANWDSWMLGFKVGVRLNTLLDNSHPVKQWAKENLSSIVIEA